MNTRAWRDAVERALSDAGKNRAWLARELGASRSTITRLLAGEHHASTEIDRICELLDISRPPPKTQHLMIAEIEWVLGVLGEGKADEVRKDLVDLANAKIQREKVSPED